MPRAVRITLVVLLLAIVGFAADQAARTVQLARLTTTIERSEQVMLDFEHDVEEFTDDLEQTYGEEVPPDDELDLILSEYTHMADAARLQLEALKEDVAASRMLLWHGDLDRVRVRYHGHVDAWVDALAAEARGEVPDGARVEASWHLFVDAYTDAVPVIVWGGLDDRIASVIDDGGGSRGGNEASADNSL